MNVNEKVSEWISGHREELVKDIKDFCAIPSVKGESEEEAPYGIECLKALKFGMELCEAYGFTVQNYGGKAATADFDASLPRYLDILAHTDVVPPGEGWTVTEPFNVVENDGKLYGRGTSDDKGPLLASLYALRAIRECGIPLKKGVRLIMGSDEECGSSDIEYYYSREPEAPLTFSPDAEFPLVNIEKGQFRGIISKEYISKERISQKTSPKTCLRPRLLSIEAGHAVNAVPERAYIKLDPGREGITESDTESEAFKSEALPCMREIEERLGAKCSWLDGWRILVEGVSAHASTPEFGKNAGLAAIELCLRLPLEETELKTDLRKIIKLFPYGVTDGSGLGIAMSCPESHDLTLTLDLFNISERLLSCEFDARTPLNANEDNCYERAAQKVREAGFSFTVSRKVPPHKVPADSEFVKTLLAAYEDVTGLKGECLAIGGGTYVHDLKNGVAFGAILPGVDTRMHGADEFMPIDDLLLACKVYAEAIIRLCA